jgi:gliding motility-associated-like protein
VNVTLTQPAQLTIAATSTPAAVCEGSPVTLNATPAGGTPAYSVEWTPGNLIGNTQTLVPPMSGPYSAVVTDANGCTAVSVVVVTVYAMPSAAVNADVFAGCAPVCVNFSDVSTIAAPGTITGWNWDFGDGNTSTQQAPNHCYDTPGAYDVILTVTSGDGCTSTITMANYINVYANPVASFTASPQPTTIMNPEIFFTDQSINADAWNWTFGDIVASSSTVQNPSFVYPDPTCYQVQLTVTTIDGCVDDTIREVCIDPDVSLYVPNAFTPDDNGTNDVFLPVGIGMNPDKFEMWIFDRWGNMIFYTDDMSRGWDGRVNGGADIAQIDTYVWKIKATDMLDKKHDLIGKVSLVK